MEHKEIVIWHEMDSVCDNSLHCLEQVCHELEEKENLKFKLIKINIVPFLERLQHIEKEEETPDIVLIPQDMITFDGAKFSDLPQIFGQYMAPEIWNSMNYKGVQRGVPFVQGNHAVIFYNKKYFKKAPTSWEEISAFHAEGVDNFSMDLKVSFWFAPFVYSLCSNPIVDGKVVMNNENTKPAQDFIADLKAKGVLHDYSAVSTMIEKFVAGEIACILNGEWVYEYLYKEMGEDVGICELPMIDGKKMTGISSSVGLAFPANAFNGEKRKELEIFTHYMLSKEVQVKWLTEHRRIPVNSEVLNELEKLSGDANIVESYKQMKNNFFMVNEACLREFWDTGEIILKNIG